MFGLTKPKLPVSDEQKEFIDRSFLRLASLLGAYRLLEAAVILPTAEHFPDPYDRSEESLQKMFRRVAALMRVDADEIDVELFFSDTDIIKNITPFYSGPTSGAAGLYHHNTEERAHISINEEQLKDPGALERSHAPRPPAADERH